MTLAEVQQGIPPSATGNPGMADPHDRPRDLQRTFQMVLATVWLLDAVLQLQPIMFTPGPHGLNGMLRRGAEGNPSWIAHTITWNASIVDHHPVLSNTPFALIEFLIGFGIVWTRTRKAALALSIAWSLGVWWFGEGLGGIFSGKATPFWGGPGGVLFYAVLAVLSVAQCAPGRAVRGRPGRRSTDGKDHLGRGMARSGSVVGGRPGRSPQALHDLAASSNSGEPGWLTHIDGFGDALFLHDGTALAVLLAVVCLVVAVGVFLPPRITKATIFLAILVFGLIWVVVQDVGGILAGGATDPNAAPLVILLALIYWPISSPDASMIPTPSWLYYLFGALVLVVAAYGVVLLIYSVTDPKPPRLGCRCLPCLHGSVHVRDVRDPVGLWAERHVGTGLFHPVALVLRPQRAVDTTVGTPPHPLLDPRRDEPSPCS